MATSGGDSATGGRAQSIVGGCDGNIWEPNVCPTMAGRAPTVGRRGPVGHTWSGFSRGTGGSSATTKLLVVVSAALNATLKCGNLLPCRHPDHRRIRYRIRP